MRAAAFVEPPRGVRRVVRRAGAVGGTTVQRSLRRGRGGGRYRVVTDRGTWRRAPTSSIATGPHGVPRRARRAWRATRGAHRRASYRNPAQLPTGGVLVVGASASGVQIADELNRAGREVMLAVGRHTRMPRRYRGMDIFWWLERTGRLARTIDEVADPVAARREPSLQLVGRQRHRASTQPDVDLGALQARGVRLAGRLAGRHRPDRRASPTTSPTSVAAADADDAALPRRRRPARRAVRPRRRGLARAPAARRS